MSSEKYILVGHDAIPCNDLIEWAKWFEIADRHVASEKIGEVRISTVFLGLDHSFGGPSPLLFETMIFGGKHDGYQERCTFWDDAVRQHEAAVLMVQGDEK